MEYSQKVKLVMKLVFAVIWNIVLPLCYANSRGKYTCYSTKSGTRVEEWCFTSYMVAAAIYLTSNAVELVLFFVPAVAKYIEVSNYQICKVLSWWIQVDHHIFVTIFSNCVNLVDIAGPICLIE